MGWTETALSVASWAKWANLRLVEKKLIKVRSTISYLRNFRYLCCMNNQRGYTPAQLSARCQKHVEAMNDACGMPKKYSANSLI